MALKKATKEQAKLRLAIYGLSGGGKTYSALAIAEGLVQVFGGKIAVLDTEFRSASKYANIFQFETDDFGSPTIENYIAFINMVKEDPDVTVLIIDSLTHVWQWCLQEVDRLTRGSSKSDSRNAWKVVSPLYDKLVNALLTAPFHVIGTMRAKTEWSTASDAGGKSTHRDTLAPVQREGFEFEFDMLMEMNQNHFGSVIKDRSGKFQDVVMEKPGIEFGKKLAEWLKDGVPPQPEKKDLRQQVIDGMTELKNVMLSTADNGSRLFTDDEYGVIKKTLGEMAEKPENERLIAINALLDNQKVELQTRYENWGNTKNTSAEAQQQASKPAAETPATPSKADPKKPKSLSDHLTEIAAGGSAKTEQPQTASTASVPETESFDDGFVDDVPGEETEAVGAQSEQLDIF